MRFAAALVLASSLSPPAFADEPVLSQSVVTTPTRTEEAHDLGLELLWLPVESRTSITDFVGRNLPGAQLDASGRLSLSGGGAGDAALELDGLRYEKLSLPLALVDRFDVANAGYGAAWNDVPGGVVALTSKAGDNRFHANLDLYHELRNPVATTVAPSVSGAIVRDRLFYVVALRGEVDRADDVADPAGIVNSALGARSSTLSGGFKLIWRPRAGHQIESLTLIDEARRDDGAPLGVQAEAQPTVGDRMVASSLRWIGRFGARFTASSTIGVQGVRHEEMPLLCRTDAVRCANTPPIVQTVVPQGSAASSLVNFNWPKHERDGETRWQLLNTLEARLFERASVREVVRVSSRLDGHRLTWASAVPGDALLELAGNTPAVRTTYYANDPRDGAPAFGPSEASGSTLRTAHALESETRLWNRVWLVPGVGLATALAHSEDFDVGASAVSPHLSIAWDVGDAGRTWLYVSSHQRVDTDLDRIANLNRGVQAQRRCLWNPDTNSFDKSCVISGGPSRNTIGQPCGPDAVAANGTPCASAPRLARAWEHTAGASHELGRGFRVSADLVYRRPTVRAVERETNSVWNASGTDIVGYRDGRAEKIGDYSTSDVNDERYLGVTGAVRKQAGLLKMLISYTFSQHRGDAYSGLLSAPFVSAGGLASDDRPHSLRALVSGDLFGWASLGMLFSQDSGVPINRYFRNDVAGAYENYRATTGTNPGTNINDPSDDRPLRAPDVQRLNLQVRVRARRLLGVDADLYLDAIHVLHDQVEPLYARAGLEARY